MIAPRQHGPRELLFQEPVHLFPALVGGQTEVVAWCKGRVRMGKVYSACDSPYLRHVLLRGKGKGL